MIIKDSHLKYEQPDTFLKFQAWLLQSGLPYRNPLISGTTVFLTAWKEEDTQQNRRTLMTAFREQFQGKPLIICDTEYRGYQSKNVERKVVFNFVHLDLKTRSKGGSVKVNRENVLEVLNNYSDGTGRFIETKKDVGGQYKQIAWVPNEGGAIKVYRMVDTLFKYLHLSKAIDKGLSSEEYMEKVGYFEFAL